jgi:glycosyltransferase involved in cell wall biosynthesis
MSLNISVVIPTHNRAFCLKRAIDSVLSQTFPIKEILVVNNASDDNTEVLLEKNYKQIKVLYENNIGVSFARNTGIRNSKSNWIAFLDSDDEWMPKKIEKQVSLIKESSYKYRIVHTNELWFKNNKFLNQKKIHKKKGGYIFENCLHFCKISPSSVIIHRELFKKYGLFDTKFSVCEDYELWLRITSQEEVGFIEEPMIKKHAGHLGQLSKKYWGLDRYRIRALEKLIKNRKLNEKQMLQTIKLLLKKIDIVLLGGINRKNKRIINIYTKKRKLWNLYYEKFKAIKTY